MPVIRRSSPTWAIAGLMPVAIGLTSCGTEAHDRRSEPTRTATAGGRAVHPVDYFNSDRSRPSMASRSTHSAASWA